MPYAVFKNNKQVTKWHSTRLVAIVEAFEKGFAYTCRGVFGLFNGVEIRKKDN